MIKWLFLVKKISLYESLYENNKVPHLFIFDNITNTKWTKWIQGLKVNKNKNVWNKLLFISQITNITNMNMNFSMHRTD